MQVKQFCLFYSRFMNKKLHLCTMMKQLLIILTLLCVFSNVEAQDCFTVMSYNVENLFDTIPDAGKEDKEFLPEGEYKWTGLRLFKKLKAIGKVIVGTDTVKPCEVVGLCEVENDSVMTWLTERTQLRKLGYKYIMTNSEDPRGIDVALLYSPFRFRLIHHEGIRVKTKKPTRDVLYASGTMPNGDTLDIYMLHLPSQLGLDEAGKNRRMITERILTHSDSVFARRQKPTIIIMGDFNDELRRKQMTPYREHGFRDMTEGKTPGTYKYKGDWGNIDHIMLRTTRKERIESGITNMPMLLERDKSRGGKKPRRTFLGTHYHGGVSDHLPIWIKLSLK